MKFVVVKEVNGKEESVMVNAEDPNEAIMKAMFKDFESGRVSENDIATVGVYEVSSYNHLIKINEEADFIRWSNNRIEELKQKIKELTGENK